MRSDFQRQLAAAFYLTTRQRVDSDSLHDVVLRRFIRREARISGRPPNRQYPGLWAVPKPTAYVALNTMPIDQAEERLSALLAHGCDTVEAKLNAESLGMLGEAVVLAAGEVLPTEVIKLGEQFHHVDAAGKREILRAVHHILSPRPGAKDERRKRGEEVQRQSLLEHWLRDMQNQPLSRVIPRLYGRWDKGIGNPNCFGKAQLLYGFALRFGIECLGCTPIQTARDTARGRLKSASMAVLRASLLDGIVLHPRLVNTLTELYYSDVEAAEIPEAPHFGAVFRLCDGSWFLLDPHAHVEGALDSEIWKDSLDRHVMPILSNTGDVFPGLGVMADDPFQQEVLYDAAFGELITFAKEAALLQREFHTLGRSMIQKCVTLFARSKAVEMIINEPDLLSSHDRWTLESILKGESSDAIFEALRVKCAPGDAPM
ncbi:MAG: hypothetical protein IT290_11790, partial [Deltaproteobacteria bacterium]|nr:hypothetical protein [Deltaproteobacteria bacterium]